MSVCAAEPVGISRNDSPPASEASDSRRITLLFLLGLLPYLTTLRNEFIYDDYQQIVNNPYVHSFRNIRAVLGSTFWSFQGAEGGQNYYRPLVTLVYMLGWSVAGPIPLVYHLVNITLQAANVAVVYWVTRRLWRDSGIALAAAAFFAMHPIHTEPVAWISGLADLSLTFFYLVAFGLYLEARRPGAPFRLRLAMLASFVLALFSKEIAVTLPAVVLTYEHFYSEAASVPEPAREKVSRYGSLWVLAGLYSLARVLLVGGPPHSIVARGMNLRETVLSGIAAAGLYLGKLVWPAHLHLAYSFHKSDSPIELSVLAGFVGLAACALLFRLLWKPARLATFGLIWLALTLAPVLNLRWMPTAFAERYLYLPSVGFCWLLAYGVVWVWRGPLCHGAAHRAAARGAFAVSLAVVLIWCAVRIETRNRQWSDQTTFVLAEIAASPGIGSLHDNRGSLYLLNGNAAAAEREWNTALRIGGEDEAAFTWMGILRSRQKRYPEAFELLWNAVRIRPTFVEAHLGLADAYAAAGGREDAEFEYREALNLAPLNLAARNLYGQFLYDEGRWSEAEREFRRSAAIEPSQQSCDRLGDLASARGDSGSAIRDYAQAAALEPFDAHAHFRLGDLYAAAGRAPEAAREYRQGLTTNPNDSHALAALSKLQNGLP